MFHVPRTVTLALLLILLVLPSARAQEGPEGLRLDVGGYGSFRGEASDAEDVPSSLTLRRFVVTTDARWGERLRVYSEVEYERLSEIEVERGVERSEGGLAFEQELEGTNGSEIALEQAWAQLELGGGMGVRFGAVLPPVGRFNLHHDDNLWNLPRRPLSVRGAAVLPASAAWTEMGLGLVGEHEVGESGLLAWEAYVLNGVTLDFAIEEKVHTRDPKRNKLLLEAVVSPTSGAFDGSNAADALAARLAFSPRLGTEVALSGYTGDYTPPFLDVDARLSTLGVDGATRLGPLLLEGELLLTRYAGLHGVLEDFARIAVDHATETSSAEAAELETEAEVELTGLASTRRGLWVDLAWPLALPRGTLGLEAAVLSPVVRYERAWLGEALEALDFAGGVITELEQGDQEQERLSLGVAFRPLPQAVVHLVYEHNRAVVGGLIDPGVGERSTHGLVLGMAVGF